VESILSKWEQFASAELAGVPEEEREKLKEAFYCGALAALHITVNIARLPVADEVGARAFTLLVEESKEFKSTFLSKGRKM
jgi:hypothetical protein